MVDRKGGRGWTKDPDQHPRSIACKAERVFCGERGVRRRRSRPARPLQHYCMAASFPSHELSPLFFLYLLCIHLYFLFNVPFSPPSTRVKPTPITYFGGAVPCAVPCCAVSSGFSALHPSDRHGATKLGTGNAGGAGETGDTGPYQPDQTRHGQVHHAQDKLLAVPSTYSQGLATEGTILSGPRLPSVVMSSNILYREA